MIKIEELKTGDRVWAMVTDGRSVSESYLIGRDPMEFIFLNSPERTDEHSPVQIVTALVETGKTTVLDASRTFLSRDEALLAAVDHLEVFIAKMVDGRARYVAMLPEGHGRRKKQEALPVEGERDVVDRIRKMGEESLSPDAFAGLEVALANMSQVRRGLTTENGEGGGGGCCLR